MGILKAKHQGKDGKITIQISFENKINPLQKSAPNL